MQLAASSEPRLTLGSGTSFLRAQAAEKPRLLGGQDKHQVGLLGRPGCTGTGPDGTYVRREGYSRGTGPLLRNVHFMREAASVPTGMYTSSSASLSGRGKGCAGYSRLRAADAYDQPGPVCIGAPAAGDRAPGSRGASAGGSGVSEDISCGGRVSWGGRRSVEGLFSAVSLAGRSVAGADPG